LNKNLLKKSDLLKFNGKTGHEITAPVTTMLVLCAKMVREALLCNENLKASKFCKATHKVHLPLRFALGQFLKNQVLTIAYSFF